MKGEVVSVANMGQLMPNSDAKVFEVKIKVSGSDPELKPAMTTSNTIQTTILDSVLYLPIESVFSNDSMSFVYVSGEKRICQIVEPGDKNENYVVIRQGLSEGQSVLLNQPENVEDYDISGMEIYADILKKKEAEKTKKAEEELRKKKEAEQIQNVAMPTVQGIIISGK
jgi:hypothetical protein